MMRIRRLDRLPTYLKRVSNRRFRWGRHDCALFVADAVRAISDWDPAERWRGYTTKREALRIIDEMGGLDGLAKSAFGEPHIEPRLAKRGDVVLARLPQRSGQPVEQWQPCLGLVVGGGGVAFAGRIGWDTVSLFALGRVLVWGGW